MPYMLKQEGEKFKVYKKSGEGEPEGEALGTHDSEEEAKKQMAALHAQMQKEGEAKESAIPKGDVKVRAFMESHDFTEAVFDEENHSIEVTLISPGWSKNNRYYSRQVLGSAAKLFEGIQAYADHPSKTELKERPARGIRDLAGWYENVRQEESTGKLKAKFNVIAEWLWPIAKAAASRNSKLAGLSINAGGDLRAGTAEGKKGYIVEAINVANSIDVVTSPAAGGAMDAILASDPDEYTRQLIEAMSINDLKEVLREARPDLVAAWQKEWKTPRDTEALTTTRAELDALKETVTKLEEENRAAKEAQEKAEQEKAATERKTTADRLLSEVKLPKEWVDTFREELYASADEEAMKTVIGREEAKAALLPSGKLSPRGAGAAVSAPVTEEVKKTVSTTVLGGKYTEAQLKARNPREFAVATEQRRLLEAQQKQEMH